MTRLGNSASTIGEARTVSLCLSTMKWALFTGRPEDSTKAFQNISILPLTALLSLPVTVVGQMQDSHSFSPRTYYQQLGLERLRGLCRSWAHDCPREFYLWLLLLDEGWWSGLTPTARESLALAELAAPYATSGLAHPTFNQSWTQSFTAKKGSANFSRSNSTTPVQG